MMRVQSFLDAIQNKDRSRASMAMVLSSGPLILTHQTLREAAPIVGGRVFSSLAPHIAVTLSLADMIWVVRHSTLDEVQGGVPYAVMGRHFEKIMFFMCPTVESFSCVMCDRDMMSHTMYENDFFAESLARHRRRNVRLYPMKEWFAL